MEKGIVAKQFSGFCYLPKDI
jgi:hypothetical protein